MKFFKELYLTNLFFILYGVVLAVLFLGYLFPVLTWIGLGFLALIFCISLIQAYQLFKIKSPITAQRKVPKHFSLHDENTVRLHVENMGEQSFDLRIIDELPEQLQVRDFLRKVRLNPTQSWNETYYVKPIKRGKYSFGNINIFLAFKYGLCERKLAIEQSQDVKVYPSFIQMRTFELMVFSAERTTEGIKKVRKRGHGLEFSDIKHYALGDDPRTINWKATSRRQELMVNNYQVEKSQQVYAVINNSRVMHMPFNGLNLLDYSINSTLSLLNIVLRSQDHAGLMTFSKNVDTFISAQRRAQQRQLILDALYNQQETTEEPNYEELYHFTKRNLKGRSLLLLFTNFMSLDALERNLPILRRLNKSHLLVVIFFENTELQAHAEEPIKNTLDITSKVMADKLLIDLQQIVIELRKVGIQAIKTKPEDLTTNTINKYLELKAQGFI